MASSNRKINLSKFFNGKRSIGQKYARTVVCFDNCVVGQKSLGKLSPWMIVPWTIVATPDCLDVLAASGGLPLPVFDCKYHNHHNRTVQCAVLGVFHSSSVLNIV